MTRSDDPADRRVLIASAASPPPPSSASRTFASLRFRNYRLYAISQLVSFSGTWMQGLAMSWLVLDLTGSGTALGTVTATQFVPTLLLAPAGGVIADRFEKRRLIIFTQTLAGLLAGLLGVLTLTGRVELWMVYVISIGFGSVTAIDNPSRNTFVMEMVGPADIGNAVSLNSVVVNGARIIGPAIGGVIIATAGIGECFMINAFSFTFVIAAMLMIRTKELHPTERSPRAPRQLRDGFRYAWSTPDIRTTLVMLVIVGTFTYEFTTTIPMFAEFTFGAGSSGLAAMTALMGVGAVFGGLTVAATGQPTPTKLCAVAAAFGFIVSVTSFMPTITLAYAMMPLVGAASTAVIALSNATLQLKADPKLRGRIMALFSMAIMGSTPIGGPIVGLIGDHASPRYALLIGGVAALAAAGYGWRQLTLQTMSL